MLPSLNLEPSGLSSFDEPCFFPASPYLLPPAGELACTIFCYVGAVIRLASVLSPPPPVSIDFKLFPYFAGPAVLPLPSASNLSVSPASVWDSPRDPIYTDTHHGVDFPPAFAHPPPTYPTPTSLDLSRFPFRSAFCSARHRTSYPFILMNTDCLQCDCPAPPSSSSLSPFSLEPLRHNLLTAAT